MTSSLVGSEMCIRDSSKEVANSKGGCLADWKQSIQKELETLESLVAVSYTHLTLPTICSV
eukprot:2573158-Prorocentrum_lima.AAC.1